MERESASELVHEIFNENPVFRAIDRIKDNSVYLAASVLALGAGVYEIVHHIIKPIAEAVYSAGCK